MFLRIKNRIVTRLDKFISNLFYHEGIDNATLRFKKAYWISIVIVVMYVALMYIPGFYFDVSGLLLYGILLLVIYVPLLILFPIFPSKLVWMVHLSQHLAILFTFYIVVTLGGIQYSGGIIFAALCAVIYSVMFYSAGWSVWYFALFVCCTSISFVLQSVLQIEPEMSPKVNKFFFLFNTLFLSGLTLAIVLVYLNQYTRFEKERANRLKELNNFKSKFYTNISHEFRTPLTVILGLIDQIERENDNVAKHKLEKIRQNSNNLLSLVEQMLNLSKLDEGVIPVNFVQEDIIRFIKYVSEPFEFISKEKNLTFSFYSPISSLIMDFDPEKLTQIISNLLANAIKFTPEGGSISLSVFPEEKEQKLMIIISDTGIGIPLDKTNLVFERFFQVDNNIVANKGSSGLGLSITKELVHLLKGEISIDSQQDSGTKIKVTLPIEKKTLTEPHIKNKWFEEFLPLTLQDFNANKEISGLDGVSSLLIVEDSDDVRNYICSLFSNEYKISTARNGLEGLKQANELIPDIIISDIMMPEMDGIELLKQLKSNIITSHIPVVLLTAKADMESRIQGISFGAEAYLSKPFNKEELHARIVSLLKLRKELQMRYSTPGMPISTENIHSSSEDVFMDRLNDFFNKNFENDELLIKDICAAMNMSRSQLYRKFKAITNRSITEYFRSFRLYKAKNLLLNSTLNVTQVAFEVGFKNLSHFSQSFSKEFGISPSKIKTHRN